jgi:hypothetical protein
MTSKIVSTHAPHSQSMNPEMKGTRRSHSTVKAAWLTMRTQSQMPNPCKLRLNFSIVVAMSRRKLRRLDSQAEAARERLQEERGHLRGPSKSRVRGTPAMALVGPSRGE